MGNREMNHLITPSPAPQKYLDPILWFKIKGCYLELTFDRKESNI